jgi:diguanylate cyclase (GGDEF)-like protein/PAS domain S-box-containing protein
MAWGLNQLKTVAQRLRLLPQSLLGRVFLLFSLTLGAMLAGGLAIFLHGDLHRGIEHTSDTGTMVAELASLALAPAALGSDQRAVANALDTTIERSPFAEICFTWPGGDVQCARAAVRTTPQAPAALEAWLAEHLPAIEHALPVGAHDVGVLRLRFHTRQVANDLWLTALQALAGGAASLVLGLLLTRRLLTRWLADLDHLGDVVQQIQAGRFGVKASVGADAPAEVRRVLERVNLATTGLRDGFRERIHALSHSLMQHKWATDQAISVIEIEPDGTVAYVNERFEQISGFDRAAFVGRREGWSLQPQAYRDLTQAAPTAPPWTGELACTRADGSRAWVSRTVVPIRDDDGTLRKFICLDIDISRLKATEQTLQEEKERAEVTLHSIDNGVITVDADRRIRYTNPAAQRIVGRPADWLRGRAVDEVLALQPGHTARLADRADRGQALAVRLPDGHQALIDLFTAPLHAGAGVQTGEVLALRDVTTEQRNRQELERLSLAVQHSASAILITDPVGRIEYVNPKFTEMTGFTRDEIGGQTPRFLKSGQAAPEVYDTMWAAARAGLPWRGELLNRRKDGSTFWCSVTVTVATDEQGRPRQFVSVMEDVSERKEAEATIHRLAYFDALTALPNRRMFMERAVDAVKAARASGQTLAACYLDLDGFKDVNDSLGHPVGDALLAEVARRIGASLHPQDFLGRLGGDEFALLLHDAATTGGVAAVGQRIIDLMETAFVVEGHQIFIGTSIGVSMFPHDGQDVADLLRKADMALYQAKAAGKRKLVFFTDAIEARQRERSDLEQALRVAQQRGELRLVYQPKIDIASKAVTGAEALLRWLHPVRGLVRPDEFIPLAEETRLIVPIGRWVLEQACRQIRAWTDMGIASVHVAVNISSVQFRTPELVDDIERIIGQTGIDASQLEIELTESGLMEDPDGVARTLHRLRALGLTIAIDDFGTGYSSLAYLKSFPVGVLKIDRSFVRDLETDANDRGIAEAVISMARVLKVDVVAEGVETRGQLDVLEAMGCQLAQGYYISQPLPAEAFPAFWGRHRAQPSFAPTDVGAFI